MLKYQDVFVPGGFPRHTYNARLDLNLETRLGEIKDNLCKLVTVTGQTKSGKTVLARKVLPPEECIWIDGGTAGTEDEFWQLVIEQLDLFQDYEEQEGTETSTCIEGKGTAEANFLVAKGSGEVGASLERKRGTETRRVRSLSSRVVALSGLKTRKLPLVIDDFHYLPPDLQGRIVRALKPIVFDGLPVAVIAIPHRRFDAVKVEREMAGRISGIEIPSWSNSELSYIPETGFKLLGYELDPSSATRLASQALGSPHLMQDFCRGLAKQRDIKYSAELSQLQFSPDECDEIFRDVADTIGRPIFEKLARGPRQRTDRIPRELKDGRRVDIYELVLHALASIKPGLVSLEYEDLRSAIREVSSSQLPQLHEVARVLKHMATIASTDQSSTPVIDFEEEEKKLHITDPFFAFYLRWGDLS
ncbi:hypothetical protein [Pseudothauera lacus]|uniref:hypothetical protein n=1 Tax=Pseudothauera lacus TaxID=2136175 RepID=UPI001C625C9F|nr:hypothetical protein [Pseudothauera lacus]